MAGEDAALLRKIQADEAVVQGEGDANGFADGEQPFTTENINNQEKKETVTDDQVLRASSPSDPGTVSGGGDPSSLSSVPAVAVSGQEGSRSSSRASTRKPKIVGGFIADDSDEEYDASTPEFTISLQPSASNTPNRAVAPSPLHYSVSQADVKPESQTVSTAGASTSNTLSVNPSIAGVTPSVPASQAPNSAAPVSSVPKARLPHDKVGILEDRIQEDPRGDVDAWHLLIDEHLSRNKLDGARSVYQRFFQVFPQAVSSADYVLKMSI
jgi:cleavage stimulation factor subunit 3